MKLSGKWEMIQKNPYGFEIVRKMGNDLEKSVQFVGFSVLHVKNFQAAMLLCHPGLWASAEVLLREFTFYFYFMFSQFSMLWLTLYYRLPIRSSSLINLSVINQLQFINAFFVGYHEIIM